MMDAPHGSVTERQTEQEHLYQPTKRKHIRHPSFVEEDDNRLAVNSISKAQQCEQSKGLHSLLLKGKKENTSSSESQSAKMHGTPSFMRVNKHKRRQNNFSSSSEQEAGSSQRSHEVGLTTNLNHAAVTNIKE